MVSVELDFPAEFPELVGETCVYEVDGSFVYAWFWLWVVVVVG